MHNFLLCFFVFCITYMFGTSALPIHCSRKNVKLRNKPNDIKLAERHYVIAAERHQARNGDKLERAWQDRRVWIPWDTVPALQSKTKTMGNGQRAMAQELRPD